MRLRSMEHLKCDIIYDAQLNRMYQVDFSDAQFSSWVTFIDCDLSTAIPPKGVTFDSLLVEIEEGSFSTASLLHGS